MAKSIASRGRMHPGRLRLPSVTYQQYAPSSRLAGRALDPRSSTDLAIPGPKGLRKIRAIRAFRPKKFGELAVQQQWEP